MDYPVKMKIIHLCSYITDKSAVLNHVNRDFNLKLTMKDIDRVLANKPKTRELANREPMTPSAPIVTHRNRGYDPLARALFQYHADRTTGAEHDYWLSRLLEKGKRPNLIVSL